MGAGQGTGTPGSFDRDRSRAFSQRLMGIYGDAMVTTSIALGQRTGLTAALAEGGCTSQALAARAGLHERYVREWLHLMTVAGVVDHADGTFTLPPEHAISLVGESFLNTTAIADMATAAAGNVDALARAFATGEGAAFHEQAGDMPHTMDRLSRARFDTFLVDSYLASVPDLVARLEAGIVAVDVGCGTGHVANLIAAAYPSSDVRGLDPSPPSIERAREEAASLGLGNATFDLVPVAALEGPVDLVTAFDVIHDLGDPAGAVAHIRSVLAPGGVLLMCDSAAPPTLEERAELPWAPMMYGLSTFGCIGTARSQGGEGLGNMWGREAALALLSDAGFADVEVLPVKGDPMNALYVARV